MKHIITISLLFLLSCGGGTITTPDPPPVQVEPATVTWVSQGSYTWTIEALYLRGTPTSDITIWTGELQGPGELTHTFPDATSERIRFRYSINGLVNGGSPDSVYGGGVYEFALVRRQSY